MTHGARGLPADLRSAPVLVKAFPIAPVVAGATEWAYSAHVRSHPGPFVAAAVVVLLVTAAVIRRHVWAWALWAVLFLVDLTGLVHYRHPVHRPLAVAIVVDVLYALPLFSPAMLRWVGVSQRWSRRTGSGV
jgi:hypothetical protein